MLYFIKKNFTAN